jgi:hypothetical protein
LTPDASPARGRALGRRSVTAAGHSPMSDGLRGRGLGVTLGLVLLLVGGLARADDRPVIVDVAAPPRLQVGVAGQMRLAYRAPRANVVSVVQALEDADGPALTRATREREFRMVARAFGYESGELTVPLAFATPGLKRVTLRLITDEGEESDSATVEVEAFP